VTQETKVRLKYGWGFYGGLPNKTLYPELLGNWVLGKLEVMVKYVGLKIWYYNTIRYL